MSDTTAPDTPAVGRSVPGWLKGFLLTALAFVGSWGGAIVSDLRQARTIKGDTYVVLSGINAGELDSSADETKRVDPKLVRELTERLLKHPAADLADIAKIIADTDHQSG